MLLLLLLQAASAPAASTRAASIASETTRYLDMTPALPGVPVLPLGLRGKQHPRERNPRFEAEHREWLRLMIDLSWH